MPILMIGMIILLLAVGIILGLCKSIKQDLEILIHNEEEKLLIGRTRKKMDFPDDYNSDE